jgi:hypothetical protein
MGFEVGKKVIALHDIRMRYTDGESVRTLNKGDIFIINSIRKGFCNCMPLLLDIGFCGYTRNMCSKCKTTFSDSGTSWWFDATHFAPLEEDERSDTSVEEFLEKMEVAELVER